MKLFRLSFEVNEWNEDGQFESENYLWFKTKEECLAVMKDIEEEKKASDSEWADDPDGMYGCDVSEGHIHEEEIPTDEDGLFGWIKKECTGTGRPWLVDDSWYTTDSLKALTRKPAKTKAPAKKKAAKKK